MRRAVAVGLLLVGCGVKSAPQPPMPPSPPPALAEPQPANTARAPAMQAPVAGQLQAPAAQNQTIPAGADGGAP